MFTVKHIDTDGTERLYAAETVEVVNKNDVFSDGIYLDWPVVDNSTLVIEQGTQLVSATRPEPKHVIHFSRARSASDVMPKVFVMNKEGSTVATYRL